MSQHLLRCRCGTLRGHVTLPALGQAVCYCKDCRAYAYFLEREGDVLDDAGGTQIAAQLPERVGFEPDGLDALKCMTFTGRVLRWYAGCCNTPIGNTAASAGVPYVGLVHSCLGADPARSLEASFWPARMRVNTESATKPVASTPLVAATVMLGSMPSMLGAWLGGGRRRNPFFHADSGEPIRKPRAISADVRARLKARAAAG